MRVRYLVGGTTTTHHNKVHAMVHEVLEHKPTTWAPHEHARGGLLNIVCMEGDELKEIRETGNHAQVIEALTHVAAAAIMALHKMTCP